MQMLVLCTVCWLMHSSGLFLSVQEGRQWKGENRLDLSSVLNLWHSTPWFNLPFVGLCPSVHILCNVMTKDW